MELDPPEPPVVQLEAAALEVVGKDWFSRADKVFTSNLGKYRKYKGNSVRDLLRAMRNKVSRDIPRQFHLWICYQTTADSTETPLSRFRTLRQETFRYTPCRFLALLHEPIPPIIPARLWSGERE